MPALKEILYMVNLLEVSGDMDREVAGIGFDSREIGNGDLFVAITGSREDGHDFISQSIQNGAKSIVCERFPSKLNKEVTYVKVDNSSTAFGIVASNYYGNPSSRLVLVGVTGTNGKTTTATLLYDVFRKLGYKVGLISTVDYRVDNEVLQASQTTPNVLKINDLLSKMISKECTHCFMEVSSHSLDQERIFGLEFTGTVFTNVTHDHLDYHNTFDNYIKSKKKLFDGLPSTAFALVNADDKHWKIMLQNTKARKRTFGLKHMADYKAKILSNTFQGLGLRINQNEVWFKLIGEFNASNIMAVYGASIEVGESAQKVLPFLSEAVAAPGRFEQIFSKSSITGVVDYAHTPDALKNVLKTIQAIRTGNERVITVIGCGGDRDKAKRPIMASVACKFSDKVILTSDNPRSEDPGSIIEDMKEGVGPVYFKKTLSMIDRKEAIKTACLLADSKDIILVAGKGHENYQEIKGVKYPFDDKVVLSKMLSVTN